MRLIYKISFIIIILIYAFFINLSTTYSSSTIFTNSNGFINWGPTETMNEIMFFSGPFVYSLAENKVIDKIYETKKIEKNEAYNLIVQYSTVYGYDVNLALSIAFCESGFNRLAVSPTGAKGVYQFIKTTFDSTNRKMGRDLGIVNVFNAEDNISAALWKLSNEGDGAWRPWSGHCYLSLPVKN